MAMDELLQSIGFVVVALLAATGGAGAAWFWQARALRRLQTRLDKSEKKRAAADERSQQARAQVTQLQQALAAAKAEAAAVAQAQREAQAAAAADDVRQRRERLSRVLDEGQSLMRPRHEAPAHGFADTLPVG